MTPSHPDPTFSIIVPTYNRPEALTICLSSIAALDYPRDRFEVIVVDDGSAIDPTPLVESFRGAMTVRCLRQANAGPAAARNAGAAIAVNDFLAFTDDDCTPQTDWLRQFAAVLSADADVLVGGYCRNALPDNPYAATSHAILDVVNAHFNHDPQHATFFPSDNIAMSRRKFIEFDGFDPAFRCSEDRDLCDRWTARGWRMVMLPQAVIDHARHMRLVGFIKQHFGYGRGAWLFHQARKMRQTGKLEVEGSFYFKCFREPFKTHSPLRAVQLACLLCVWQLANTAGFFWEAIKSLWRGGDGREAAAQTSASSSVRQEESARK